MLLNRKILIAFCFAVLQLSVSAQAPPVMTNAEVQQMTSAGFSAELVITKIKASKTAFDTSTATLTELKKAGVSESVLMAMIEAGAVKPAPVPDTKNEEVESAKAALRSLRRMTSSTDVGITYVNYGPLLAEIKTEVEENLTKMGPGNLRNAIEASLREYEYAGSVWRATLNRDLLPNSLEEVAVNKYGMKRGGLLKVIFSDAFLKVIWREARNQFEIANSIVTLGNPTRAMGSNANDELIGAWVVKLVNPKDNQSVDFNITITTEAGVYKGTIRSTGSTQGIAHISKTGSAFVLKISEKRKKEVVEMVFDGTLENNQMTGAVTISLNGQSANGVFTGTRLTN